MSLEDEKRKARAEAMAAMLLEENQKNPTRTLASSQNSHGPVMCDPNELNQQDKWSKTKISQQIPGWSISQKREIDYLTKWIKSLWDEQDRGGTSNIRSPPVTAGPAGVLLRAAFFELLYREISKGVTQKLPERIWACQYADLEPLLKACRAKPPLGSQRLMEVQGLLGRRLSCAIDDYIVRVKRTVSAPPSSDRSTVLHSYFVAIGDLHRYQHNIMMSEDRGHPLDSAEKYYWQALSLKVGGGKVWNQLAVCALTKLQHQSNVSSESIFTEGELLSTAVYRYFRALTCTSPFPSKENLLPLTGKLNAIRGLLPVVSSLDRHVSGEEHRVRFRVFLTCAVGAVFSRVGLSSALAPNNSAGESRLSGYLGGGGGGAHYGGDVSNDTFTLSKRHLRLWVADITRATRPEQEAQFPRSYLAARSVLGEAVLLLLTNAFSIGQDSLKKNAQGDLTRDEMWQGAMQLIEGLLGELLAVPDTIGLGGLYLFLSMVVPLDPALFPDPVKLLKNALILFFKEDSEAWAKYLNRLLERDCVASQFEAVAKGEAEFSSEMTWEEQEARGFIGWSQASATDSSVGRKELEENDWATLALFVLKVSLNFTKQGSENLEGVLELTFNQRGRPHYEPVGQHSPSKSPGQSVHQSDNNIDSILELLKGVDVVEHSNPPRPPPLPPQTVGDDDDDEDEEFLLLKPSTEPESGVSDAEGLSSFFAGGGALPEGVDSLIGEIEADGEITQQSTSLDLPPGLPIPPKAGLLVGVSLPSPRKPKPPKPYVEPPARAKVSALPIIVLDAPNIAMRHGSVQSEFSSKGIALAAAYFGLAGHRVVGFLPDFLLDFEKVAEKKRTQRLEVMKGDVRNTQLPNDVKLLRELVAKGLLIGTPPQDYDDSYCIRYAQSHNGYVCTNDMYRDHVSGIKDKQTRESQRAWTKSHLISYTFVGDEFLPNPNFSF